MGSSEKNKIVLGVVGAVGVVFISYLVYRKWGEKIDGCCAKRKRKGSDHHQGQSVSTENQKLQECQPVQDASEEHLTKTLNSEEDPNQISFVVLDGHGENQSASSKKSDRSSDESSYDVVEAEDMEESQMDKTSREGDFEEPLLDYNEASVVELETDPNEMEASSSSFYHSADETVAKDVKGIEETMSGPGDDSKAKADDSDTEADSKIEETYAPTTDFEPTVESSSGENVPKVERADSSKDEDDISLSMYTTTACINLDKQEETTEIVNPQRISTVSAVSKNTEDSVLQSQATSDDTMRSESEVSRELGAEEITAVLTACQNSPMSITKDQIYVLVMLLQRNNPTLQPTVLDSIVRVSAFTQNNTNLRAAGCESVICHQVVEECTSILKGHLKDDTRLVALTKVLTNLSMDPKAAVNLEQCVTPLIEVLVKAQVPEPVQLSILRPLINLCSQENFHSYYIPAIPYLYAILDSGSYNIGVLAVKVLVNLSLNESMVPYMLSPKAPNSLLDLVDKPTHPDVILRVVTMIGNLRAVVAKLKIDQSSLPAVGRVESPKTMFTALCGVVKAPLLRNKVSRLTRHSDEDIRTQASKLYTLITVVKK